MYTNQELDSIVSTLSSFTPEELNYLKTKIDLILNQHTTLLKDYFPLNKFQNKSHEYIYSTETDRVIRIVPVPIEPIRLPTQKLTNPVTKTISVPPIEPIGLSTQKVNIQIKSAIKAETEEDKFIKKHRRHSGMWKGKVKMPDDFDDLSNDILADFGID